jgi:hypothetical protein
MTTAEIVIIAVCVFAVRQYWLIRRARRKSYLSASYREYINSPQWRRRRKRALALAGHRCEHRGLFGRCRNRHRLQVHHLHYRNFTAELDEDLKVLCTVHHSRVHASRSLVKRAPSYMRSGR